MSGFDSIKEYESLLDIEECIRFYPPDIEEINDADDIFDIKRKIALYIHIPFCKSPCGFCPFNQYNYDGNMYDDYFNALEKEIQLIKEKIDFSRILINSVWVGGGTPLDLNMQQLTKFLTIVCDSFEISNILEFTIEGKPVEGMITNEKIELLCKYGVTRISLGVQSTNPKYLKLLGRNYTFEQVCDTIRRITAYGLNLNLDMIYNIPGESMKEVIYDVKRIAALKAEHISWFHYISHTGTPLTRKFNNERVNLKRNKEEFYKMYKMVHDIMSENGYNQYTPYYYTNGRQCQYHIDRWKMPQIDVLGLGAGAFSTFDGWIYTNAHTLDLYIDILSKGQLPIKVGKKISKEDENARYIVLGCKFFNISISEYKKITGIDIEKQYADEIKMLQELGLIEISSDFIKCTEKGQAFNNAVATGFSNKKYYKIGQPQPLLIRGEGL